LKPVLLIFNRYWNSKSIET